MRVGQSRIGEGETAAGMGVWMRQPRGSGAGQGHLKAARGEARAGPQKCSSDYNVGRQAGTLNLEETGYMEMEGTAEQS